jgi:hypothetical protein
LREPQVSLYFNVPLVGAQNKMLFHEITQRSIDSYSQNDTGVSLRAL